MLKGRNDMRVFQEEIFGPVLAVTTFKDEAEALEIANDTMYGLGAGVWTPRRQPGVPDGPRRSRPGACGPTATTSTRPHAAFGGYKTSGVGRENHKMMLDHYTQTKCLLVSYDPEPARVLLSMGARVTATPEALEAIERLRAVHGPLAFFQSGGCCDGSSPICLKDGELPAGPNDVLLGTVGGAPFYIDSDQDERWRRPTLVLDVADGAAMGFSLEGLDGVHFLTVSRMAAR